jgi:hypothetical protein
MTLSTASRFVRATRVAMAASLLLFAASAAHATTVCKTLANGRYCLTDWVPGFGDTYWGSYQKWAGSPVSGYMQLETRPRDYVYGNRWFTLSAGGRWQEFFAHRSSDNRCGRGWLVVPAQGLTVATPWTC